MAASIPATMPGRDVTLTAKWKVNQYTISFNSNGSSYIAPITQDYGTIVSAPADPTREGYTFAGWTENGTPASIPSTMPARNIALTANWTINQYTISFDSNGGSLVAPITQDYGTEVDEPTAPTRAGYTFEGWKLLGDYYTFSTMPAKNITLVAEWTSAVVTKYDLWIDSVQVNSVNCCNILGDNTVSYDHDTKTLILNGANITKAHVIDGTSMYTSYTSNYGIYATGDLNIVLIGENRVTGIDVTTGNSSGIAVGGLLTISDGSGDGTGKLIVTGGHVTHSSTIQFNSYGINCYGNTYMKTRGLIIKSGTVIASGGTITNNYPENYTASYGIYVSGGTLTVEGGWVEATGGSATTAYGSSYGISSQFKGLSIDIKGGTVIGKGGKAGSKSFSFGIASPYMESQLIISGGTVEAIGGDGVGNSAGISHNGGSEASYGSNFLLISGGTVTVRAGTVVEGTANYSFGIRQSNNTYGPAITGGTLTVFGYTSAFYKVPDLSGYSSSYTALAGDDESSATEYNGSSVVKYFHIEPNE